MSDYDFRPGGSLKLKTGVVEGGVKKKKKRSEKSKLKDEKSKEREGSGSARDSPMREDGKGESSSSSAKVAVVTSSDRKTEAERRFEEVQRRRLAERVKKMASKTHKDRVHEFNAKLEDLSEHHDIPKVGPG